MAEELIKVLVSEAGAAPGDGAAAQGAAAPNEDNTTTGAVTEPVTLANANAMKVAGERFITNAKTVQVRFDMRAVEATSVAVAVTLAWLGSARRAGKELCLANLSADFSGVIEFSGITSMFAEHITVSSGEPA